MKGIIIGVGKVIPGVSGAILANMLGIYEKGLKILSNIKQELLANIKFILAIGIGILLAMVFGSKIIIYFLNNHYLTTMFCFMGMIIGGIKHIFDEVRKEIKIQNIFIFLLSFFSIILLSFIKFEAIKHNENIFIYFLSGISEAISTIVPGISGTALLMMIGTYNDIMNMFANLFNLSNFSTNLLISLPFFMGLVTGIIITSKIINHLFKRYKTGTYFSIIGFSFASVVLLFIQTLNQSYFFTEIFLSFVVFIVGYIIIIKMPE